MQVKFILNAVQDPHKQNVAVVAGDLEAAHQEGVRICRQYNTVDCDRCGDLVIASPGGSPRDCNLYQAQKALATAEVFARKDGDTTLILVVCAEDGIGPGSANRRQPGVQQEKAGAGDCAAQGSEHHSQR